MTATKASVNMFMANSTQQVCHLSSNRRRVERGGSLSCYYDEISTGEQFLVQPEKFPQETLEAIPDHRVADFSTDGYAEPRRCVAGAAIHDKEIT